MRPLLGLLVLLIFAACAGRFRGLTPGMDEAAVRAKLGPEEARFENGDYSVSVYPGKDRHQGVYLKFVGGKLVKMGTILKWILGPELGPPPRRLPSGTEAFIISAKVVELGLPDEGIAFLRRHIAAESDTAGAQLLPLLYVKADRHDSAFVLHRELIATAKDPKELAGRKNNLLACYIQTRRYDEGERYAQELLADSSFDAEFRSLIHYNLACIYSIQNRKALAVAELRKSVELKPDQFSQAYLDGDDDFENIRSEPGYLEIRARLQGGKRPDRNKKI